MRKTKALAGTLAVMMMLTACGNKAETTTAATTATTTEAAMEAKSEETTAEAKTTDEAVDAVEDAKAGYTLIWQDNFDGDKLNEADWNYEEHEVGWVNHELQEYVASEDYAYVKDGMLVIQPVKDGDKYYSGRVNTQNKQSLKYGRIEASIKVPEGKGFLPAFWMMPDDEDYYGQWPKCGEIDIMEVLGNDTKRQYGTLHFGEPHTQRQGSYDIEGRHRNASHCGQRRSE